MPTFVGSVKKEFTLAEALALSAYVAAKSMATWGNSIETPTGILLVGPIGALFTCLAVVIAWFYLVLHVTREPGNART